MYSILLQVVEQHHYLGVLIDNMDPTHTLNLSQSKLSTRIPTQKPPSHLKERAYKQIVLPSIEYCSTIWDPYSRLQLLNWNGGMNCTFLRELSLHICININNLFEICQSSLPMYCVALNSCMC